MNFRNAPAVDLRIENAEDAHLEGARRHAAGVADPALRIPLGERLPEPLRLLHGGDPHHAYLGVARGVGLPYRPAVRKEFARGQFVGPDAGAGCAAPECRQKKNGRQNE